MITKNPMQLKAFIKNKAADIPGVEIIGVDNLRDAVKVVFGSNRVNHDEQVYPDE